MGQSHKIVSTDNFWRERRAEADSNRGPSAYQPNVLPLAQTGLPPCPHPHTHTPPHHHQRRLYATIIPIRGRWHRTEPRNCVKEERSRFVFVFYASGSCFFILQLWAILRFFCLFLFFSLSFCTGGLEFTNLSHLTYSVFYGKQNVEQASLFPPPQIEITANRSRLTVTAVKWNIWYCFSSFLYLIITF